MAPAVFLTLVLAQSAPPDAVDPAQIERIRKALTETHAITVAEPTRADGSVFRVTVHGRKPERLWEGQSATPSYVRPWLPSYHHEFLEQVTPEEFRGATLYPIGIPVLQIVDFLVKDIKSANRKRREANAREEVRRALEELLACRANPEKRGC
jgi:hypothetical protein